MHQFINGLSSMKVDTRKKSSELALLILLTISLMSLLLLSETGRKDGER